MQRREWGESDIEVMLVLNTVESSRDSECGTVSVCGGETEGIKPTSGQPVTPRELIKEQRPRPSSALGGKEQDICRRVLFSQSLHMYVVIFHSKQGFPCFLTGGMRQTVPGRK